jgi:hypothetical protein
MSIKSALAAGALLAAGSAAAQNVTLPPDYSATYAQDRAEIEDLMARYLMAIDYFDWDSYVGTFAPDGEIEFASGKFVGRDVIREGVINFSKGIGRVYHTEDGNPAILRHAILQSSIRVEGDRAWGRTLWVEMANHGPGDTMKMGTYGLYEDEFVRIDGKWLIKRRNVLNEFIRNRHSGPENPVREMDALAEAAKADGS